MASKKGAITQERILTSAREEFLQHGFAGASMSQIGEKAGVTKALLFHYFKNKEELWRNVKDTILTNDFIERAGSLNAHNFEDLLNQIFALRFELYSKNSNLVKMMLWQRLERDSVKIAGTKKAPSTLWHNELKLFQSRKEFGERFSIVEVTEMIFSLSSLPFLEGWGWVQDADKLERYKQGAIKLLIETFR